MSTKRLVSLLKKCNTSNQHWLEKLLDEYLEKSKTREAFPSKHFHPSSISDCNREIQYSRMGAKSESPPSGKNIRVMDQGNWTEKKYKDYFEKMGVLVTYQGEARIVDPPIKGTFDFVIKNPDTSQLFLIELKTRREEVSGVKWEDLLSPYRNHEIQWSLYSKAINISDGLIIYENKNRQEIKIFEMTRDENLIEKTFIRLREIQKAIENDYIVPKPMGCSSFFCNYKKRCNSEK